MASAVSTRAAAGSTEINEDCYAAFLYCCKRNDKTACACLKSLKKRGIHLQSCKDRAGNNMLHAAVSRGACMAARLLVGYGLGTGALNNNAKSAMALAEDYRVYGAGYRKTFELLQQAPEANSEEQKVIPPAQRTLACASQPRLTAAVWSQDGQAANADPTSAAAVKSEDAASNDAAAEAPKEAKLFTDPCPELEPASEFLGRNIARVVKNGGWEEGLVVCDDGQKGLVVKFGRGQEHHTHSTVKCTPAYAEGPCLKIWLSRSSGQIQIESRLPFSLHRW